MKTAQDWLYCISGALLFSFSMNVFLVPLHIYSAGFLGIAQLLRDLLQGAGENICRAYGNRHTV